jgi:hypothetical protein
MVAEKLNATLTATRLAFQNSIQLMPQRTHWVGVIDNERRSDIEALQRNWMNRGEDSIEGYVYD